MRFLLFILISMHTFFCASQKMAYFFSTDYLSDGYFVPIANELMVYDSDTLYFYMNEEFKKEEYDENGFEIPWDSTKSTFLLDQPDCKVYWKWVEDSLLYIGSDSTFINFNIDCNDLNVVLSDYFFFLNIKKGSIEERRDVSFDDWKQYSCQYYTNFYFLNRLRDVISISLNKTEFSKSMASVIYLNKKTMLPVGFQYLESDRWQLDLNYVNKYCVKKKKLKRSQKELIIYHKDKEKQMRKIRVKR